MLLSNRIGLETLKLLVEVARADHEIAAAEHEYIVMLARQTGASAEEIATLGDCLTDGGHMPAPDYELLRRNRAIAMRAVSDLIAVDGRIVKDERSVVDRIQHILDA